MLQGLNTFSLEARSVSNARLRGGPDSRVEKMGVVEWRKGHRVCPEGAVTCSVIPVLCLRELT